MIDFTDEKNVLKTELKTTEAELSVLQARLKQLPDTSAVKAQLLYLKGKKVRDVVRQDRVEVKKLAPARQTRRKKEEMEAFRSDITQAIKVNGRGGKVFAAKHIINTLKTQGYTGNDSDAQIVRQLLGKGVNNGWLVSVSRGKYQLV